MLILNKITLQNKSTDRILSSHIRIFNLQRQVKILIHNTDNHVFNKCYLIYKLRFIYFL